MLNLSVDICGVRLKNPVVTASGTFASAREYAELTDVSALGAITTKGVAIEPWEGNPPPRIAETYGGMLNSVGLENAGLDSFLTGDMPFLRTLGTAVIVNIIGRTVEKYAAVAEALADSGADLLELNIFCPNVKTQLAIGADPEAAALFTREVKKVAKQPVIVKLSPNVTDITEIARAVVDAGADGISLINTMIGMAIDINTRQPKLKNRIGGLSGPAIKPIAVRMVNAVSKAVSVPIIGMGGIMTAEDAIEFIMAGASAVAVGTATFTNPNAANEIIGGIRRFAEENGIKDISEIRGVV